GENGNGSQEANDGNHNQKFDESKRPSRKIGLKSTNTINGHKKLKAKNRNSGKDVRVGFHLL
ncbi:MAG: hypothetical protein PHV78_00005, partial [Patescibacteria group bacterium]|nr:hypothetical protein [Patescibacteria group bacterium]MDD5395641.1 hypothetical protein [Patescibacteria group bacterium]